MYTTYIHPSSAGGCEKSFVVAKSCLLLSVQLIPQRQMDKYIKIGGKYLYLYELQKRVMNLAERILPVNADVFEDSFSW